MDTEEYIDRNALSNKLLDFWFSNKNVWFDATDNDDIDITRRFYHYLDYFSGENCEDSPVALLSKIILYDQLTRHFYRTEPEKWSMYLPIACKLACLAINRTYDRYYTAEEKSFLLMPLRHSAIISDIKLALNKIKEYMEEEYHPIYKRFYYHTLKKFSLAENLYQYSNKQYPNSLPDRFLYYTVIDRRLKKWFANPNLMYNYNKNKIRSQIFNKINEMVVDNRLKDICVSLSGGVDSMLVLAIMIILKDLKVIDSVIAFHINYGNRYKSWLEREFVIRFCEHHDVPLIIRDINEIKRDRKSREIYEDITRYIRYELYKLIKKPIFFGHNCDDCLENMVTNLKKGQHYENLYGMQEISEIDDVIVYRPLLKFTKDDIYDIVTKISLHHTRNSTPIWCDRWNIRNIFLSFVEKKQPGFTKGLICATETLRETYKMIDQITEGIIKKTIVVKNENNITISIPNYTEMFHNEVWNKIIIKLCTKYNIKVPSHKSITNFLLRKDTSTPRVKLGKNLTAIYGDTVVITYIVVDDIVIRRR